MAHVLIIGAGIIGAALAFRLGSKGHQVTVVEALLPATGASGRSFGWINASYAINPDHFALRLSGMAAHLRLARDLPGLHRPSGCLWWEETGPALMAAASRFDALGYPARMVAKADVSRHVPMLKAIPDAALFFETEGWIDPQAATMALLDASGARVITGVRAQIDLADARVQGVVTPLGRIIADHVVVAAGTGAAELFAQIGTPLPMAHRPGVLVQTSALDDRFDPILVTPDFEIRQQSNGQLITPAVPHHQASGAADPMNLPVMLDGVLRRLKALFDQDDLAITRVIHAERPVPQDELPVLGKVPGVAGLWVAVMHSGVTLAAIVAEGLADEIGGRDPLPEFLPFLPDRLMARP